MARFVLALTLASLCWGDGPQTTASVGVFVDFEALPTSVSVDVMKKEVAAILRPAGLRVDWRVLSENRGTEAFDSVVVMRFTGKCQVPDWPGDSGDPAPGAAILANTLVSEGRVLPFSEVRCDQVRRTLPAAEPGFAQQEQQFRLGRALGRVVAHELYHVLAGTTLHAVSGVARAWQPFQDLISGPLKLRSADAETIRSSMLPR